MTTFNRSIHKEAYKFAAVALWAGNERVACSTSRAELKAAKHARTQAGRILASVATTDEQLDRVLRKYSADLDDFIAEQYS